uniref:Toll-like receptor n=1 Tax=Anadara kagoshimensis TaxID=1390362 RepID=A0A7H0S6E3_9BIVA|nr:toll-like receptor [Anadara sativa]
MADNKFTMGWYVLQTEVINGVKEFNGSFQHTAHNPYDLGKSLFERVRGCDNQKRSNCEDNVPRYETDQMLDLTAHLQKLLKQKLPIPICKSVEKIHFSQCSLRYKLPKLTLFENNITYVDLSGNILYDWEGPILNVHKIRYLDLSNNYCSQVSDVFFQGFKNLQTLLVNSNILGYTLNSDEDGRKLGHLKALKQLDLSSNYIYSLSPRIFAELQQLEHLNMSRNTLREWYFDIKHMHHLKSVDLSYNQLVGIREDIRHSLDRISVNSNVTLDFTGNNFMCTCSDLEFMKWFLNSKLKFRNFESYTCRFQNGTIFRFESLKDIVVIIERDCSSKVGLIAGLSAAIFVAITVITGGIVYRYRWKLRYLYYMTKSSYWGYSQSRQQDGEFEFDAFVSYADSDRKFVTDDMLNNLEQDGGCRLCIHHRDFIPGLDIADNITSSIHKSNKTILILSPDFLKSYWCMFEFNMARMESIYSRDGRNVLFLVFYKNVSAKDLPLMMLDLIESQSYIEYPNDPQGNIVFWDKVKEAMSM